MSSQAIAEDGSYTHYLMSPLRTKQAIDAQIPIEDREKWDNSASVQYVDDSISSINIPDHAPYDGHLSSTDNPHNVTKAQVGLGNVPNFPISSTEDAEGGVDSGSLMSPLRTKQAIDAHVPINGFNSHMEDSEVHVSPEDRSIWDSKATQTDIDNTLESMNLPNKADFDQAMEGTNDTTYMTPFRVHQKVTDANKGVVQIVENVLEYPNPDAVDATGGYGHYRTIPNFGASVTFLIQAVTDLEAQSTVAKISGGAFTRNDIKGAISDSSFIPVGEVLLRVRTDGSIAIATTEEPVPANHFISVTGVF